MRSKTMRMRMWLAVSKPVSADCLLCLHTHNPVQKHQAVLRATMRWAALCFCSAVRARRLGSLLQLCFALVTSILSSLTAWSTAHVSWHAC